MTDTDDKDGTTNFLLPPGAIALARRMLRHAEETEATIATAESCTGGLVAGCLTEIPGGSSMFERGFVTYSDQAKTEMLGVPAELIRRVGAVSREVAAAMAEGALANSQATLAVSTTGVAGPDGGSAEKPVGMVCFGLARKGRPVHSETMHFPGDRAAVRLASVEHAIRLLLGEVAV
jgi:nicotinamide-nucleotide amidase